MRMNARAQALRASMPEEPSSPGAGGKSGSHKAAAAARRRGGGGDLVTTDAARLASDYEVVRRALSTVRTKKAAPPCARH